MAKYRRKPPPVVNEVQVAGSLYLIELRVTTKHTEERIRYRILLVGCEPEDIERKLRWRFDVSRYKEFSIAKVERVRNDFHILTTNVEQLVGPPDQVIDRTERSETIKDQSPGQPPVPMYAVGIATRVSAKDPEHALRKVGHALVNRGLFIEQEGGAKLSSDSTVTVEEIAGKSGVASPRDVSNEKNRPHFVRG